MNVKKPDWLKALNKSQLSSSSLSLSSPPPAAVWESVAVFQVQGDGEPHLRHQALEIGME